MTDGSGPTTSTRGCSASRGRSPAIGSTGFRSSPQPRTVVVSLSCRGLMTMAPRSPSVSLTWHRASWCRNLVRWTESVSSAAFSDDGAALAVTDDESRVLLFDVSTGDVLAEAPGIASPDDDHSHSWANVTLLPGGDFIIGGDAGVVRVLDGATLAERRRFEVPRYVTTMLQLAPDGTVVGAGTDGVIRFDSTSGEIMWRDIDFAETCLVPAGRRSSRRLVLRRLLRPARRARPRHGSRHPHPGRPERKRRHAVVGAWWHRAREFRQQRAGRLALAPRRDGPDHAVDGARLPGRVRQPGRRPACSPTVPRCRESPRRRSTMTAC